MPRNFKVGETAIDLALNIFESKAEPLRRAGFDITGLSLLPAAAHEKVAEIIGNNGSLLPFIETGFKALIFAMLPSLTPTQKHAIGEVIDTYIDSVRAAFGEDRDDRAEGIVTKASGQLRSNLDKALAELAKMQAVKPTFAQIEAKLSDDLRREILAWTKWMHAYHPESYQEWTQLKEKLDSVERVQFLMSLVGDPNDPMPTQAVVLPGDPHALPIDFPQQYRTTRARIEWLKEVFEGPGGIVKAVKDALLGNDNPDVRKLEHQLDKTTKDLRAYTKATRKKLKKRRRQDRPVVRVKRALAAAVCVCAFVAFTVMLIW